MKWLIMAEEEWESTDAIFRIPSTFLKEDPAKNEETGQIEGVVLFPKEIKTSVAKYFSKFTPP